MSEDSARKEERRRAMRARVAACLVDAPPAARERVLATFDREASAAQLAALFRQMESLPSNQRVAFTLRFSHGLSLSEVATRMRLSSEEVERHITSALACLRQRMGSQLDFDEEA